MSFSLIKAVAYIESRQGLGYQSSAFRTLSLDIFDYDAMDFKRLARKGERGNC